ncbi:MAG TPA: NUDIX hydrolase [Xanthomonadaceae bacterium]|jgi:8-oxo-dGTP pyrophosphatase MutT (NUDIX family)
MALAAILLRLHAETIGNMNDARRMLDRAFADYQARWPEETGAPHFREFLVGHVDAFERALAIGHFTGSAWLVSADGRRVLLTHHRKLGLWLQLGGHADGDIDLARVALREAEEESGLQNLEIEPGIFDLDRHRILARGADPEHWHYDVRYVVRARGDEVFVVSDESHALAWREIAEVAADEGADASVRRMARKWVHRAVAAVP